MYSYQYRLPDERIVTVRADRESEAQQIVAGSFDGGDGARLVEITGLVPERGSGILIPTTAECLTCGFAAGTGCDCDRVEDRAQ